MKNMKEKKQEKLPKKKQEKQENPARKIVGFKEVLVALLTMVLPGLVYFFYCFMYDMVDEGFVANEIRLVLLSVVFLFVVLTAFYKNGLYYDNAVHPWRFLVVYTVGILLVVVNTFLTDKLWLFLPLAVTLVLFSGLQTGIVSYILLLYLQMLITGADPVVFFAYVCIGMIGITLFSYLDVDFLFGVPLFTGLVLAFAALLAMEFEISGYLQ